VSVVTDEQSDTLHHDKRVANKGGRSVC